MKRIIFLSLVLFSNYANAQNKDNWFTIITADGLADNFVMAIVESSDGALWFGTWNGVSRLKDAEWTKITMADGLAENNVKIIFESSDSTMWFGTAESGVSCFKNGQWTTFTVDSGLADNIVKAIAESNDGAIWFGTYRGGVTRFKDGDWKTFTVADGLANNNVTSIVVTGDGAIWVGTYGGGVSHFLNGNWTTFTTADGLADNNITSMVESNDGAMWFGTFGEGVSCLKDGNWTSYTEADSLVDNYIQVIAESTDGSMWFGTLYGVSRFKDRIWTTFSTTIGLVNNDVRTITESTDGAMWFGTPDGVSRFDDDYWIYFTSADGLVSSNIDAIIESSDSSMWFGSAWSGVSRFKNGNWTTFTTESGLASNKISEILESSDGALWFGTYGGGVSRLKDGSWTTYTETDGLANNHVSAIVETKDGTLWFGTYDGVSCFKDGNWLTYSETDGLANNDVRAIVESSDNALWFGTYGGGASRFYQGYWTTFTTLTTDSGLTDNNVYAIIESRDRKLYFLTLNGICCLEDGNWSKIPIPVELSLNMIFTIVEANDGAIWFGSWETVGRLKDGHLTILTASDGLVGNIVYTIYESFDGSMWFGTNNGVIKLEPDKNPPFTFIVKSPGSLIGIPTPLIHYHGKDYRTPDNKLLYSCAVVNSAIIPDNTDYSVFTDLTSTQTPPLQNGIYTFYVRAKDTWGNIDPTPATCTFTVDITHPTLIINSPYQQQHIKGKTTVIGSAFDNSPIKDFEHYKLYYGAYISEIKEPQWKDDRFSNLRTGEIKNDTLGIFNTIGLDDGLFEMKLWAIDSLQHTAEDKIVVMVDNTRPRVKIDSPGQNDSLKNKVDIHVSISDLYLDKYLLEYQMVFQNQWQVLRQDTLSYSLENQNIYPWENSSDSGQVCLKLTAWDKAGNFSTDSILFLLDNKDYVLTTASILYPPNRAHLHDLVRIRGYATDKNFSKYLLSLKSQSIDTVLIESSAKKENQELYVLDTKLFSDDVYNLSLTVFDDRQYQRTVEISFTIDNTPPIAKIFSPLSDSISCYVQIKGEAIDSNLKSLELKYAKSGEKDPLKHILIDTAFTYWNTMDLDGFYTLSLTVEDSGGLKTKDELIYYISNPIFDKREGLEKKQGVCRLYIPPNGYHSSVICIEEKDIDKFEFVSAGIEPTGLIFEIHSNIEDRALNKPAILTIRYENLNLDLFNERKLKIFLYENNNWHFIGGTAEPIKKIVSTAINRLGIYGLFESDSDVSVTNKDLLINCKPRMFSPKSGGYNSETNIIFNLGEESNITINIFNLAGRIVRNICENRFFSKGINTITWNGKDSYDKFCLSGMYVIVIHTGNRKASTTVMVLHQ